MDFLRKWIVGRDLKRARALEGEGYYDQALPVYESCLEMANPAERAVALRQIGYCALKLGKLARSREALAEVVKLTPTDPDAWLLLGQVQLELRDTIGADEACAAQGGSNQKSKKHTRFQCNLLGESEFEKKSK